MASYTHFYLLRIQFLGYRYSGWQKQDGRKTIQGMLDKTVEFILGHGNFRTLGAGRTDAKVSAEDFCLELFLFGEVEKVEFLQQLNQNLPSDIRVLSILDVDRKFNVLLDAKTKDYHYHFTFGEKYHPSNAPYLAYLGEQLDIDLMMETASIYLGTHNFKRFAGGPLKESKNYERTILSSEIVPSKEIYSAYPPSNSFIYKVRAKGFMRYQVRLMMGALEQLGKHEINLEEFKDYLNSPDKPNVKNVVPGSGLRLNKVEFI
ncbi:MAG: tRNA pseudouridine(38-40) synthase TruA [Flavobacteriales bacterium]